MSRIVREIKIGDNTLTALFDTGSANTYIRKELAPSERIVLTQPLRVNLGGQRWEIKEGIALQGEIEGQSFFTDGYIIEDLGTIDGRQLDAIIGARTMEGWEIKLDPKTGTLDLSGLKKREFIEY